MFGELYIVNKLSDHVLINRVSVFLILFSPVAGVFHRGIKTEISHCD